MKTTQLKRRAVALLATLALSPFAIAQTTVTTERPAVITSTGGERVVTTTTRVGRVGTVTPDTLVMEAASGTEPVPYVRTTRTVFVDETGAVVPADMIRPGVPVTIHYSQDADRLLADRVVVHRKTVVNPAPAVIERNTVVEPARKPVLIEKKTTTTTVKEPAPVIVKEDDDDDDDD